MVVFAKNGKKKRMGHVASLSGSVTNT